MAQIVPRPRRQILDLRADLTRRLGTSFDLQAFHDAVLAHGALPLATLREQLPAWLGAPAA